VSLPPFQRLVDDHWAEVARVAHALAGPVDGDDVAQQAWTQALAAYPKLRSSQNLQGWLLTITSRCAMDAHRGRSRRALPTGELLESGGRVLATPSAGRDGTEGAVTDPALTEPALWQAVRRLPDRQRLAIALRYVADLDHAAVAQALGTTPAASRRLVSDALAALRATTQLVEEDAR
jgi:RNA polymerase sigma factor (sigma-70 family)